MQLRRLSGIEEAARGDRLIGSALNWLKGFNCQDDCDLKIDTGETAIVDICQKIMAACL
jgi:hypothetical protein